MVDVAQVIYEYTDGNSISFFTDDLEINYKRLFQTITTRPDGKTHVDDPAIARRVFTCSAVITGATYKTFQDVQMGAITYSGAYPRLTTINLDGSTTLTNIEVAIPTGGLTFQDLGFGMWLVSVTFVEKTD